MVRNKKLRTQITRARVNSKSKGNTSAPKNRRRKRKNLNFLNFSNSGGFLNSSIGKVRSAPLASTRTLLTKEPVFRTMNNHTFISHTEYLQDVVQSVPYDVQAFPVNPGIASVFPWLSTIAGSFERYRFRRLRFRYEVLSATITQGKVFLVPDFNPQDPPPIDKIEALTYEGAVGCQPWLQFDCAIPEKFLKSYNEYFVRTGDLSAGFDIKTYDPLVLYLCSQGASGDGNTVGELWVDYEIELVNPVGVINTLPTIPLFNSSLLVQQANSASFFQSGQVVAFGDPTTLTVAGGLPVVFDPTTVTFTENWTGSIVLWWNSSLAPTWSNNIGLSGNVTNLDGSPIGVFLQTVSYGSVAYSMVQLLVKASAGQTLTVSPIVDGTPFSSPIGQALFVFSPMWLSTTPPVFAPLLSAREKAKKVPLSLAVLRNELQLMTKRQEKEEQEDYSTDLISALKFSDKHLVTLNRKQAEQILAQRAAKRASLDVPGTEEGNP